MARTEHVEIRAYAKINLCLDVKGLLPGGFHEVHMIMQQILLHDDVSIRWEEQEDAAGAAAEPAGPAAAAEPDLPPVSISVGTNRPYLPTDRRNLAWQAAELMIREYGEGRRGRIRIDMKKRIPVAAGLAGGSSNCAAVIHGINRLWDLHLDLEELCRLGGELGSDVPFCVMGQAAADPLLAPAFAGDPLACHCAIASGRGTDLEPIRGLESDLVLSKPPISVSTAQAYRGVDEAEIPQRPDVAEMVQALACEDLAAVQKNMINVLENFTLKQYSIVVYTKNKMQDLCKNGRVLMSGSGPTVFGLCESREEAKRICEEMRQINRESFWTRTTR
ncbi:MAG: 4-(cytidine 5'-diphospho)-2-C-methyl-D-erythritol kinase [Firmicutes bacterium]|nr:4-(cytidine 5'-diphospho)-2-C-methyl-D-erythritol kinase [Bacillota bacterium]